MKDEDQTPSWDVPPGDDAALDPLKTIPAPEDVTLNLEPGGETIAPEKGEDGERAAPPKPPSGFDVIEEIGRGGMGVIYRARQRPLARQIALKQLPASGDMDEHAYLQFLSEALVAGHLDHPNIVPVYTLEPDAKGDMALAMKLVEGVSWLFLLHPDAKHREQAEAYTQERHLEILLSVCNAVAFAHSRNIIHRDLKPENVMIGEYGEVYVMDWGIALSVSDDPDREGIQRARHKSQVTAPAGTPSYLAPEMADARGDDMGPWTDVYLLGAILYEILTGRPPHGSGALPEILEAARKSVIAFAEDEGPEPLRRICLKAMARDPKDRYQQVADFSAEIRAYLGHRESLLMSDRAAGRLTIAQDSEATRRAAGAPVNTDELYDELFEIIAAFGQALQLWDGNEKAADGRRAARMTYASLAYREGDYKLARSQLQDVGDAEAAALLEQVEQAILAQQQGAAVTRKLRRTLLAAAALVFALLVTVAFAAFTTRQMGLSISETMHELLIREAVRDLKVNHAAVSARITRLNTEKAEMALQTYAQAVESVYRGDAPPLIEPVYYARNVDTGVDAPPGLERDARYEHTGSDGRRVASPVTFEQQTFVLAPDLTPAAAAEDIARIQRVLPRIKALGGPRTEHVIRYFTGLENGLYFAYPGHGQVPEGYDNRIRPWYVEGRVAKGILQTQPYIDSSSKRVVVSFERLLRSPEGSLLGVSGVDVDVTRLIHTSDLPTGWAKQAVVEIATPRRGDDGSVWIEVKGQGSSGEGDDHAERMSLTDWDINTETLRDDGRPDFRRMVENMLEGKTDVSQMPYHGIASLWAYAPVGVDGSSILMIVPEAAVTETAAFVKSRVRDLSLHHIRRLLIAVVLLLVLIPAGAMMIRRKGA